MSFGYMPSDYRYAPSHVTFKTDNDRVQRVFDRCETLSKENVKNFGCRKVIQEGAKYHGVWLETQPMGGEMYAKRDMEAALNNCLIFMEYQRRDGRMPGMITYKMPWDGLTVHYDWMQGDFFSIPAFKMAYHIGKDHDYLKRLYTALCDFDDYLWRYRDSDGDGCLETWCVWDTGDDNCTRLLANHVHAVNNGCWNGETAPYGVGRLPIESAEYMAYSYAQRTVLARISAMLENGEDEMWLEKAQQVQRRFREYLWDEERKFAFDRDCDNKKIDCLTLENIKCMYQGIFTQDMADDFIRLHLMNPNEFFTPMPLPNVAINDPLFYLSNEQNNFGSRFEEIRAYMAGDTMDNSWSGPSQGLNLQRSLRALLNYGHHAESAMIGSRWIDNLARWDRYMQQFNPFTGEPAKAEDEGYGPTMLGLLEYIAYLYGAALDEDHCIWSSLDDSSTSSYTQTMRGREYTLVRTPGQCEAIVDGEVKFAFSHGVRIVSDENGIPERIAVLSDKQTEVFIIINSMRLSVIAQPNEELTVTESGLVSVKKVPFYNGEGY